MYLNDEMHAYYRIIEYKSRKHTQSSLLTGSTYTISDYQYYAFYKTSRAILEKSIQGLKKDYEMIDNVPNYQKSAGIWIKQYNTYVKDMEPLLEHFVCIFIYNIYE